MTEKTKLVLLRILSVIGILADIIIVILGYLLVTNIAANFADGVNAKSVMALISISLCCMNPFMHFFANINLFRKKANKNGWRKYNVMTLGTIVAFGVISLILILTVSGLSVAGVVAFAIVPVFAVIQLLIILCKTKEAASSEDEASREVTDGASVGDSDADSDASADKAAKAGRSSALPMWIFIAGVVVAAVMVVPYSVSTAETFYNYYKDADSVIAASFKDFSSETLDGESITSDDIKGHKLVVVDLWATWCHWCIVEMPELVELQKEYADQDVYFVSICTDLVVDGVVDEELVEEAKSICEENNVEYKTIIPSDESMQALASMIPSFPTVYILDENGEILDCLEGYVADRDWNAIIDGYLK